MGGLGVRPRQRADWGKSDAAEGELLQKTAGLS
jgi:hypothetical protein